MDASPHDRDRRVRRLVEAARRPGQEHGPLRPRDLCAAAVDELDLLSATVNAMTGLGPALVADAGSAVGSALVDLQAVSGEAPTHDAIADRRPVMVDDLIVEARHRWLDFTASAIDLGCAAVWSLPLGVGALRLGVLEMSF